MRREEGGGVGTQTFVYQKWPDKIFPMVNFVFSHDGQFGLGGGGLARGHVVGLVVIGGAHWPLAIVHCQTEQVIRGLR